MLYNVGTQLRHSSLLSKRNEPDTQLQLEAAGFEVVEFRMMHALTSVWPAANTLMTMMAAAPTIGIATINGREAAKFFARTPISFTLLIAWSRFTSNATESSTNAGIKLTAAMKNSQMASISSCPSLMLNASRALNHSIWNSDQYFPGLARRSDKSRKYHYPSYGHKPNVCNVSICTRI